MTAASIIEKIEHFRQALHGHENTCILMGGAACSLWYADKFPSFRATADLDIVLVVEALSDEFVKSFKDYAFQQACYETQRKTFLDDRNSRVMYRFFNPSNPEAPKQIELLSRKGELLHLESDQYACPVKMEDIYTGLSSIIMDDVYYHFLRDGSSAEHGILCALPSTLAVLKIKAVLNLLHLYETRVNSPRGSDEGVGNIKKHRNDVFFLLTGLSSEDYVTLPDSIASDVRLFRDSLPVDSPDWQGILDHIRKMQRVRTNPKDLIALLNQTFRIGE